MQIFYIFVVMKWTKEKCHEEALKYKGRTEFHLGCEGAYNASKHNNWLDEICSHMILKIKSKNYWTKEKCIEEALKYNQKKYFREKSYSAYQISLKMGWLDEICSHMIKIGNRMFRCIYVYEFSDNSAYVGLTCNLYERNANRKFNNNDQVTKHINETNLKPELKQLTDYVSIEEATLLENKYIEKYSINGWNILNKVKGGSIGCTKKMWTKEKCQIFALKYTTKNEFRNNSYSAYIAAKKYGWLNEICSHMTINYRHWMIDECGEEALKYNNRDEFAENNKAAYMWAFRKQILNQICSHMK
jgi:hypothetical protein